MINMILPQVIFKTVAITIFHNLWQATLLVLLTYLILKIFRRMAPASKYLLLFGTSCMILTSAIVTFIIYYQQYSMEQLLATRFPVQVNTASEYGSLDGVNLQNRLTTTIDAFISTNAKILFYGWFLGVIFMIVWFTGGWFKTRNISRYHCKDIESDHQAKFNLLMKSMRITKKVIFKETAKINIPALVGWLKPVILLPVGMLVNLPAIQVEAIIAHELAHLKRGDYLTSLLQQMINILLFYHPAIWWISSAMDKEREMAADVVALKHTGKKTAYVKALTSFEEIIINKTTVTAFSGKRSHFFNRIIHIINMKHMKPTIFEKSFLLVIIILGIFALIGGSKLNNGTLKEAALIPPVDLNLLVTNKMNEESKGHSTGQDSQNEQYEGKKNISTITFSAPANVSNKENEECLNLTNNIDGKNKVKDIYGQWNSISQAWKVVGLQNFFEQYTRERVHRDEVIAEIHSNYPEASVFKDTIKHDYKNDKNEEEMEVVLKEVEKTLQEINVEKIVEESLAGIDIDVIVHEALSDIDWDEIQYQIKVALEEVNKATAEMQSEEFREELEQSKAEARKAIEEINSDEIKRELEDARREIERALEEIEIQRQRMKELEQENERQMEIEIKKEMKSDSTRMEETLKELEGKK